MKFTKLKTFQKKVQTSKCGLIVDKLNFKFKS